MLRNSNDTSSWERNTCSYKYLYILVFQTWCIVCIHCQAISNKGNSYYIAESKGLCENAEKLAKN